MKNKKIHKVSSAQSKYAKISRKLPFKYVNIKDKLFKNNKKKYILLESMRLKNGYRL